MAGEMKKQFLVQWENCLFGVAVILGGSMFGLILMNILIHVEGDNTSYFQMGTLIGILMAAVYCVIMEAGSLRLYFDMEISMGSTRKSFFVSYLGLGILTDFMYLLILAGVCMLEERLYGFWYPELTNEVNMLPYLGSWGIATAVLLPMAACFCGALIMRFGKTAFWIFWALWMVGCIGIPRIIDASEEAPDSLFGRIGTWMAALIGAVPHSLWPAILAAAGLICLAGSYIIIRKQQVTA